MDKQQRKLIIELCSLAENRIQEDGEYYYDATWLTFYPLTCYSIYITQKFLEKTVSDEEFFRDATGNLNRDINLSEGYFKEESSQDGSSLEQIMLVGLGNSKDNSVRCRCAL